MRPPTTPRTSRCPRPAAAGAVAAHAPGDGRCRPRRPTTSTTSTPTAPARRPNDASETAAIKTVFGERAYGVPISSTKSMTGHLLGAGGGVEAIACMLAHRAMASCRRRSTTSTPTPSATSTTSRTRRATPRCARAMSNSFGFGGHNATLIFRRYDGCMSDESGRRSAAGRRRPAGARPSRPAASTSWRSRPASCACGWRDRATAVPAPALRRRNAAPRPPPPAAGHAVWASRRRACASSAAPLTGVWYPAPSPGARPYVQEGDEIGVGAGRRPDRGHEAVQRDQVGRGAAGCTRILVESGTLVKRQQPLLEVDPRG